MYKFKRICVFLAVLVSLSVYAGEESTECKKGSHDSKDDKELSMALTIDVKSASVADGLVVQIDMKNTGAPLELDICPEMMLSCVKGLHTLVEHGNTGMGLLDRCEEENPELHKSYLPKGASFIFTVNIPADCLPEDALREKPGDHGSILLRTGTRQTCALKQRNRIPRVTPCVQNL